MAKDTVIVALSGGVDSAVAALLLRDAGYKVECLHMINWEDDGYCDAAAELKDAARVCKTLGLALHRVNFAREYKHQVFADFLAEIEAGRTPNPDVLCNREIKFGVMRDYAQRLGGQFLATGHYARLERRNGMTHLLKAADRSKDQSYFLHAVRTEDFDNVLFPLGTLMKSEVRAMARHAGLEVSEKKDSTGICFIGERPFAEFLSHYLPATPGEIRSVDGELLGQHQGLSFYTLGQRQGLGIGGRANRESTPWYVGDKDAAHNTLIVVQGEHPLLYSTGLTAGQISWIGASPVADTAGDDHLGYPCMAKTRYRQPDQACTLRVHDTRVEVTFEQPQRAVTPGQHVVFYTGERCLGGAIIERRVKVTGDIPNAMA